MAWGTVLSATQLVSLSATEKTFNKDAVDWKIGLSPGESAHVMVKAGMGATDDVTFNLYGSNIDSPSGGAVVSALASTDWHLITQFTVDNVNDTGEWQGLIISGYKWLLVGAVLVGTTDTASTADLKVALDGVSAS